jgi:hypothetical protein
VRAFAISRNVRALIDCLKSEDESVQLYSSRCLAGLGPSVIPDVEWAIKDAAGPFTDFVLAKRMRMFEAAAVTAVCNMDFDDDPPQMMFDLVSHIDDNVRKLAVEFLAGFELNSIVELFDQTATHEDDEIRKIICRYLWEHDRPDHVTFLMDEAKNMISRPKTAVQINFLQELCAKGVAAEEDYERIRIAKKLLSIKVSTEYQLE